MAATWRIYQHPIALQPSKAQSLAKATCVLHNIIQTHNQSSFTTDTEGENGSWRQLANDGMADVAGVGRPASQEAKVVRDKFMNYFNGVGAVTWQDHMIAN